MAPRPVSPLSETLPVDRGGDINGNADLPLLWGSRADRNSRSRYDAAGRPPRARNGPGPARADLSAHRCLLPALRSGAVDLHGRSGAAVLRRLSLFLVVLALSAGPFPRQRAGTDPDARAERRQSGGGSRQQ